MSSIDELFEAHGLVEALYYDEALEQHLLEHDYDKHRVSLAEINEVLGTAPDSLRIEVGGERRSSWGARRKGAGCW
ncbi:MAG: hypothetical protein EXR51_10045 [Dehalococcoidia bacterium]|nr:hypothetical protein [Dehalococcoidia bacterium]